ncbi:PHB depolymerase family esterase [Streptomyces sp. HPF1205]|uniref:extracellular catalytic domain type 1 short-chain-length polyhydroxyalkanoate depolymerase n=1 Tax=Streptomyces sp. HPF1205 TaxID=2873262 RepID=UPI001CEC9302|nr:PHB depolymerase family esterase [Streptomyces sp. HPF1205]
MTRIRAALAALVTTLLITVGAVIAIPSSASAASLVAVPDFGSNPGNLQMYIYVPDSVRANPAIVVAMHPCGGSGPGFYQSSEFKSLADQYGFIVIYPTATKQTAMSNCFDVWSQESKTHNGGSDPSSIVSMVTYTEQHYGGDPHRVYATGSSSGGQETNALLADYPDVFAAGSVFMGVPFTCFADAADFPPSTSKCVNGHMDKTPQEWGDAVRQAYPGYSGPRPRVQLWHGTADPLVPYQLLQEEVDQWTNVFGLSQTPTSTDQVQSGWDRRSFANAAGTVEVEAISVEGAGHVLPTTGMAAKAIHFFGLDGSGTTTTGGTSTGGTTTGGTTTGGTTTGGTTTGGTITGGTTTGGTTTGGTTTGGTTTGGTTTGGTGGGGCKVTYDTNSWSNGFTANVTVANTGSAAVNGWKVAFTLPSGQTVTNAWNATISPSSGAVVATNVSYNPQIPVAGSQSFGFQGTYSGSFAKPSSFSLNGAACTVG